MQLSVPFFSKNKSMSVWILNLNLYLEHPLIGIYIFFFKEKISIFYLFFYQKPLFYNKIHKVVNYLNIPVRFYRSVAPVPESQRLFFIFKQRLSNNIKATLHTWTNLYYHHYLLIMEINENNKKKNNNVSSGKVCRALDYSDQDILIKLHRQTR